MAAAALQTVRRMFALGIRIALPVVGGVFLTDDGIGDRRPGPFPRSTSFSVGSPSRRVWGLFLLAMVMPAFVSLWPELWTVGEIGRLLDAMMRALGGT